MAKQRLTRTNGMIAGVCGGLADFFGINVFWFRLLFVLLALPGAAPGVLPYIILWFIMPRR